MNQKVLGFLLGFFLILPAVDAAVLTGIVRSYDGHSRDDSTAVPLPAAFVCIEGTTHHAFSNAQGQYVMDNAPPGPCWVTGEYPHKGGYSSATVIKSDTTVFDIWLGPSLEGQGSCWKPIVKYSGLVTDLNTGHSVPGGFLSTGAYNYNCGGQRTWIDSSGHYEWKLGTDPDTLFVFAPGYEPFVTVVGTNPPDPGVIDHRRDFNLLPQGSSGRAIQLDGDSLIRNRPLPDGHNLWGYNIHASRDTLLPEEQFGVIDIEVVEGDVGDPPPALSHAYLWIDELRQGASTGLSGRFMVGPVPPGTYTVRGLKTEYNSDPDHPVNPIVVPARKPGEPPPIVKAMVWMHGQP